MAKDFKLPNPPITAERRKVMLQRIEEAKAQYAALPESDKKRIVRNRLTRRMVQRAELERRKENLEPLIQQQDLRGDEWL